MIRNLLIIQLFLWNVFVTFAQPACPTIQMSGSDVSCYGASDGSATVAIISGGSGSYQYSWSDGTPASGLSSTISPRPAGTYTVTVHDLGSGCSVVGAYVVGSPDPISITANETNVDCFGQATGEIDASVTGGTFPYSYEWTNGVGNVISTSEDLTGLVADTYTLTVEASTSSCSASLSFVISEPLQALQASGITTDVSCFGDSDGAIDLTTWGGTPPYMHLWDNSSTIEDQSGLLAGSFNVEVSDANGCIENLNFTIQQPLALTSTIISSDVDCFGNSTGSATVTVNGGTTPYDYSWQNSTTLFAVNDATINNIPAEDYQVTATDVNGCTIIDNVIVNEPLPIDATTTTVNVSCNGGFDGEIDLSVTGGIAPYSFVWTNTSGATVTGTPEDLIGVSADVYTVAILDNNNCPFGLSQEIYEPSSPISSSTVVTDVLCFGDATGAIDLTIAGGTPNYVVQWSNGFNIEDISGLIAGTYDYTVFDANGCDLTGSVIITQPNTPLSVTSVITNVLCNGEPTGSIDLTVSGGTPSYNYQWANSSFSMSVTAQDLLNYPAETYYTTVTDGNGCQFIDTLEITEPTPLETTLQGTDILCYNGSTGEVNLTVEGGTSPYSYNWNNGFVSEDINGLTAGVYTVTVLDFNNCSITDSIELFQPLDSVSFTYQYEDVLCKDGSDGSIEMNVYGGTPIYDISWSNGSTAFDQYDLLAGWYAFEILDANGCSLIDSIQIQEPDALVLNEVVTPVSCNGLSDGVIDVSPTGGTAPYNFSWFNSDYALSTQTEDLVNFPADLYQVEILDSNDCFYELFIAITEPDSLKINYTYTNVSCPGANDGTIFTNTTGGNPPYDYSWSNGAQGENLTDLAPGLYELLVTDDKGCWDSLSLTLTEPDSLSISFETVPATCTDLNDGIAIVYAEGGNGGYAYDWSNGATEFENVELYTGWYDVTVTDLLGCTISGTVFVAKSADGCIKPVNAFSPNGDNYNDTWVIDHMDLYPNADIQIFNKWGNKIHQQTGLYEPWDGKINGADAPSEIYYWIINLNVPDREAITGNISIVR